MARIDPRTQQRLNAVVTGLADSLRNAGRAMSGAAQTSQSLTTALDEDVRKVAGVASSVIGKAQK